jgi:ankyrin repeat protein
VEDLRVPLDRVDNSGRSALMISVASGNFDLCGYLVRAGADINISDQKGHSVWDIDVEVKR